MVSIQLLHRTVHSNPSVTALPEPSSDNVASNILESTAPDPRAAVGVAPHRNSGQRPEAPPQQWAPRLNASYLTRGANGTWYLRMVVPAHLRAQNPDLPHEIRRSTKTAQKRLALAKAKQMCLEFFVRVCAPETPMLAPDEKLKQSFSLVYIDGSIRAETSPAASPDTVLFMSRCLQLMTMQMLGRCHRAANDPGRPEQAEPTHAPPAQWTMTAPGVAPSPAPPPPAVAIPQAPAAPGQWLSDAIDTWRADGTTFSEESWTYSYKPSFRVFRELIGEVRRDRTDKDGSLEEDILDMRVSQITRAHIQAFAEGLKVLPQRQGRRTDGVEALARIEEGRSKRLPSPSNGSVAKKLLHIRPFLVWAKRKGWVGQDVVDEFALALENADAAVSKSNSSKSVKPGYVALSAVELKTLFEQHAFLAGAIRADWSYWIPLLCLYQGLRVSEGAQLYTNDVIEVDGVPCLSVIPDASDDEDVEDGEEVPTTRRNAKPARSADEYRRLKNPSSRRIVPIHPKLIELGFLDFVRRVTDISPRAWHLFYGLKWEPKSMFGRKPSEYMRDLLKEAGIAERRRKVPHSLRSNFKQAVEKTLLEGNLQDRLLGHSTGKVKDEHYNETDLGPAFPSAQVLPFLQKVDFGLTLPKWAEVCELRVQAPRAKGQRR